jgi:hypothetical protein
VRFDRAAHERDGTLRVSEVLPLGPAALAGVRVGDAVVAVGETPVTRTTNLDSLLAYTTGRRVALTLAGAGGARREVAVRPVTLPVEKGLLYRAWVESRRAYVARVSGGRLGYVHMPDMSAGSLSQLYADLDADNVSREGVVVDIRNNNGGFVNAYALDVFARRPYLTMRTRGDEAASARAQLGQRALERPDDPGGQPALAVRRRGLHGGLPHPRPGQGGGRADGRLDHLHLERPDARRLDAAPAALAHHGRRRPGHGAASTPGRRGGQATGRRVLLGARHAARRGGEDAVGRAGEEGELRGDNCGPMTAGR